MTAFRPFENPDEGFGRVSAESFARIMAGVSDMALLLEGPDARVRDVAFGSGALGAAGLPPMIGRSLFSLATSESQGKLQQLLAGEGDGRWRHVNLPVADGPDVPVSMKMFGLGGGRTLAVARDERQSAVVQRRFMAAQRELQESHARLRQADLRFQTMLALSDLAVATLDGDDLRIVDANRLAAELLGHRGDALAGEPFRALIARDDVEAVERALARTRETGAIGSVEARLRGGGARRLEIAAFRFEDASRLLVRVVGDEEEGGDEGAAALVARLPHAIVVTDGDLRILDANRAFIDLAELSIEANAKGQPLDRFLGRNGVDTDIMVSSLRERVAVREFATVMTGAFGTAAPVDVDGVRLGDGEDEPDQARYGFMIRRAGAGPRRTRAVDAGDRAGLAARMTDVVGRVSLKEIVRDTTDVIERLCIETALGMTENNRAAASEMLGISRQSLYAKLARYGIGGDGERDE